MKRISRYFSDNGSVDDKAKDLTVFAKQIKAEYQSVKDISNGQKNQLYRQITGHTSRTWTFGFKYAFASAFALIIFMSSVVAFAQHSQPGGHLYGVKKASQNIRVLVQPSYIKKVVDDRKAETEKLVKEKAPESDIDKAKHDYQDSVDKAIDSGYEAQIESETKNNSTSDGNENSTEGAKETNGTDRTNKEPIETHVSPTPTKYDLDR
jgi:hypothetical protein